ncbi:solute carrier family 9 (sodium/hydrogen exchanger), member 8 [Fistulifera solaris]|uniref:Sodium/hydrogen exchanger n=1 Tax=Fistulifera solaris TaxID=1519565 RepID=A0A1Z5KK32_FISSO|nr:solute carrier family 9 (sodium/hydrogen exchanger), member 8 [Fistulifera solaris]|eukprot:GAX26663.1 solute carrier family 9 (sodium/hydrogen exchanger), member 8 [Fistulifera solaris]
MEAPYPTSEPTLVNDTRTTALDIAEEEHEYDAVTAVLINVTLISCLLLAYYVKRFRIYSLPESAGALLIGVLVGGIARLCTNKLVLFEFSSEVFFFVLLPPIIFEAGYSLKRKDFFENIGAITLYAMLGTMISTFVVGGLCYYSAILGIIPDIDKENPMEALLFGALISAVDPVATLSIMGNTHLKCDPLLYSLVFGESVLNDAVAISLFKVFAKYYKPTGPDLSQSEIPAALGSFLSVSLFSVFVGVGLGLVASYLYKHTDLSDYPHLETSLLFCFCYLCYATSEAVGLSGIMSLFFQGMVLSHYNSYNLSPTAHVASEHIFSTLATVAETVVFLYMGMSLFTARFSKYNVLFSLLALVFCLIGRALNIFPLSWLANLCRQNPLNPGESSGGRHISFSMQCVLCFAGLRGAIAFALASGMPGPNREVYATATLFICIFTTVVCGGLTDTVLTYFDMKQSSSMSSDDDDNDSNDAISTNRLTYSPHNGNSTNNLVHHLPLARRTSIKVYNGAKKAWKQFENDFLKPNFGGRSHVESGTHPYREGGANGRGNYELGFLNTSDGDDEEESDRQYDDSE